MPPLAVRPPPLTGLLLSPETPLDDARMAMTRAGLHEAPVFDGHRVRGVISQQEIDTFRAHLPRRKGARVGDALRRRFDCGYDLGYRPPLVVELPR